MEKSSWPVKARIEHAAVELFANNPVAEVTAAAIANRAGVTERTFFRYFPNKGDIENQETGLRQCLPEILSDWVSFRRRRL